MVFPGGPNPGATAGFSGIGGPSGVATGVPASLLGPLLANVGPNAGAMLNAMQQAAGSGPTPAGTMFGPGGIFFDQFKKPVPQAPPTQSVIPNGPGSQGPSLADVISALIGPAPTAPTAGAFGAAPTLSDFFSAAPYDQARSQLQAGSKTAQGSINNAYQAAAQQMAQIASQANANTGLAQRQAGADAASAVAAQNANAGQASALAGSAGGQVQARLAALNGVLGGQNAATQALDSQLAGIQKNNISQDTAATTSAKQNALNFLASQVSGEGSKIGLAEASDQARAQQMLAAANSSRGAGIQKAQQEYQSAMNSRTNEILKLVSGNGTTSVPSNRAAVLGQVNNWLQAGQSGNQNASDLGLKLQTILLGGQGANGTIAPPKNLGEAQARLSQLAPQGSIEYTILNNYIDQYYQPGKAGVGGSQLQALESMLGGQ